MKLTSKWTLWFVLVSLYAAILGGLFYYNLFKFVFDKTESAYNEKSLSELAKEGFDLKLVLDCFRIEWEYNKSFSQ